MSINFGATFDPYALNENNIRINTYNLLNGGGLLRLTSANVNMNYSFSSKQFEKNEEDQENSDIQQDYNMLEATSSGGRDDDLFGRAEDFSDRRMNADDQDAPPKYPSYRTKIPWDLTFAYSLTYNNNRRQRDFTNNSLMFSGNIELTPKWQVGLSSGYDFKGKGFTYTQLRFNRDLNSWRLNFSWVPFSDRSSWNFFIGIKSGLLSDIKYEKQSLPNRTY